MTVHLGIVDLDRRLAETKHDYVFVNDLDLSTEQAKTEFNEMLYVQYDNDVLDVVPKCRCGHTKWAINLGRICEVCFNPVVSVVNQPLESFLWIRAPDHIAALINPTVYTILSRSFTFEKCNIIDWLINDEYVPPGGDSVTALLPLEWKGSLNNFTQNFDAVFEVLVQILGKYQKNHRKREYTIDFVKYNKHLFFPRHVPFPSRMGFVSEASGTKNLVDPTMAQAMDAIRTITSISNSVRRIPIRKIEARTAKALSGLANYYEQFEKTNLGKKGGMFRKHRFGSRLNFTGRAVLTSIANVHDYNHLHIPWSMAIQVYKLHISNLLLKDGYTAREIQRCFYERNDSFSQVLNDKLDQLLEMAPDKGLPCIHQRNPTLHRLSLQFFLAYPKRDPLDKTTSHSTLALAGPNADQNNHSLIHSR